MSEWKAKRFWKEAQVVEAEGGFAVELDGRPVRTPLKSAMTLPSRAMASSSGKCRTFSITTTRPSCPL